MADGADGPASPGAAAPDRPVDDALPRRRAGAARVLRPALVLLVLAAFGWYLRDQVGAIGAAVREMSLSAVLGAGAAVVLALLANMLSWRAVLRGLGSELPVLPAARLYLVAQLGKYLPGSVWPVLAQVELAHEHGVPRARSAAAAVLALVLNTAVGVVLAATALLAVGVDVLSGYWWALAPVPLVLVALHPAALQRSVDLVLRRLGRQPLPTRPDGRSLLVAACWSTVTWLLFGLHVWLLALASGGGGVELFLLATGAYSAAWVAGFVILFLPAGAGAREGVLLLVLTTAVPQSDAAAIALASRALTVLGDGVTAGAAVLAARRRRRRAPAGSAAAPAPGLPGG